MSKDLVESTALAAWLLFKASRRELAMDDETATVVVRGVGATSFAFAEIAHRHGVRVVAMAGAASGTYNPEGLPFPELAAHVAVVGNVKGFWAGRDVEDGELLAMECGVLVAGEMGHAMTAGEALRVRAKGVLELAPDAVSPEAAEVLRSRGIAVIR